MIRFDQARRRLLGLALASSAALLAGCGGDGTPQFQAPAAGQKYSQIVAVGSSVTDTGNACAASPSSCPPSPPYATGVASNGTLWIQTVAANYKLSANPSLKGGTNYAYGGARTGAVPSPITGAAALTNNGTPSMVQQIDTYLASTGLRADPNALYVVEAVTFGNNFNAAATAFTAAVTSGQVAASTQTTYFTAVTTAAVGDVIGIVNKLYFAGARNILLINSTDLGLTPLLTGNNAAPGNPNALAATSLSAGFNQGLAGQVQAFASSWPGLNLKSFDVFAFTRAMAADPAGNGYTNVTQACFVAPTSTTSGSLCATPNSYFYWDGYHPTAFTGGKLAARAITLLGS